MKNFEIKFNTEALTKLNKTGSVLVEDKQVRAALAETIDGLVFVFPNEIDEETTEIELKKHQLAQLNQTGKVSVTDKGFEVLFTRTSEGLLVSVNRQ